MHENAACHHQHIVGVRLVCCAAQRGWAEPYIFYTHMKTTWTRIIMRSRDVDRSCALNCLADEGKCCYTVLTKYSLFVVPATLEISVVAEPTTWFVDPNLLCQMMVSRTSQQGGRPTPRSTFSNTVGSTDVHVRQNLQVAWSCARHVQNLRGCGGHGTTEKKDESALERAVTSSP